MTGFSTPLSARLGLRYPLVAAPMFIISNKEMLLACAEAGILGAVGVLLLENQLLLVALKLVVIKVALDTSDTELSLLDPHVVRTHSPRHSQVVLVDVHRALHQGAQVVAELVEVDLECRPIEVVRHLAGQDVEVEVLVDLAHHEPRSW